MKKKLLILHPVLAPYRIDLFNELNTAFDANFYFFRKNLLTLKFNTEKMESQLNFKPKFLTGGFDLHIKRRMIRFGYLHKIVLHKPDLIICCEFGLITFLSALFARLFFKKTKIYSFCDDSVDVAIKSTLARRIGRTLCLKVLDGIIMGNDLAKDWYNQKFPKAKTVVIPIIQKEERILALMERGKEISKRYITDFELKDKNVLLFVGRLIAVKNLPFLIEVFSEYVRNNSNAVLVLVGEGVLKSKLKVLVEQLKMEDKIKFAGFYENEALYAWYSIADYFILPSTSETFGAVVNESLIGGVPVLCSNLAGASTLIDNNNGKIFCPFDKEQLLAILQEVLGESRKTKENISIDNSLMPYTFTQRMDVFTESLRKELN